MIDSIIEATKLRTCGNVSDLAEVVQVLCDTLDGLIDDSVTGSKSSYITPTRADDYKYFQTGIRQYYVVFDHHVGSYTDYANFWIKEMGEGVGYA